MEYLLLSNTFTHKYRSTKSLIYMLVPNTISLKAHHMNECLLTIYKTFLLYCYKENFCPIWLWLQMCHYSSKIYSCNFSNMLSNKKICQHKNEILPKEGFTESFVKGKRVVLSWILVYSHGKKEYFCDHDCITTWSRDFFLFFIPVRSRTMCE